MTRTAAFLPDLSDGAADKLVTQLLSGSTSGQPAEPRSVFTALVSPASVRLMTGTWASCVEYHGLVVLLAAVDDSGPLERALPAGVPAGVGLPRPGFAGARSTVIDAFEAYRLSPQRGAPVRFADDWVAAALVAAGPRLDAPCEIALEVAERSPHLADAVLAFAAEGLSVVGAARALQVHANTVIYRLERWQTLTGWDARTFPGLSLSVAALTRDRARR